MLNDNSGGILYFLCTICPLKIPKTTIHYSISQYFETFALNLKNKSFHGFQKAPRYHMELVV